MKIRELKDKIKSEGGYQDVEINDKVIYDGWRECQDRWEIIKPYIKPHQVILDIGSHYGYFVTKIAKKQPTCLVWSIEADQRRAEIQQNILRLNKLDNVILSKHKITLLDILKLNRSCEMLDTIICFSTIHYFKPAEIPELLWQLGKLAPNLIIELPNPSELDVAEKATVKIFRNYKSFLGRFFESIIKIGETPSPKHPEIFRPIILAQNFNIIRQNCQSYLYASVGKLHTIKYSKSGWRVDNKKIKYNGLNLANLKYFGVKYPKLNKLFSEATDRYMRLIRKHKGAVTDIHPRNLILTHNGIFPIDYRELIGEEIYGLSWEDYSNRVRELDYNKLKEALLNRWNEKLVEEIK